MEWVCGSGMDHRPLAVARYLDTSTSVYRWWNVVQQEACNVAWVCGTVRLV